VPSSTRWSGSVTVTEVAKPRRGRETVFDMVRSFGLMVVVVGATLLFVPSLLHPSAKDRFPPFDTSGVVAGFHDVSGHTALVPATLPPGWTPTSGGVSGSAATEDLHIGYAAPGKSFAGLNESVGPTAGLVATVLGAAGAHVSGTVPVDGVAWQRRTSSRGEVALVHRSGGIAVVVTGSASQPNLVALAASLRPAGQPGS
jgi:Protein of unknown function (DUF4245)